MLRSLGMGLRGCMKPCIQHRRRPPQNPDGVQGQEAERAQVPVSELFIMKDRIITRHLKMNYLFYFTEDCILFVIVIYFNTCLVIR